MSNPLQSSWPELPLASWRETCETLHLWTQIVGKIRLARAPWLNHSWHVALYVTARGARWASRAWCGRFNSVREAMFDEMTLSGDYLT